MLNISLSIGCTHDCTQAQWYLKSCSFARHKGIVQKQFTCLLQVAIDKLCKWAENRSEAYLCLSQDWLDEQPKEDQTLIQHAVFASGYLPLWQEPGQSMCYQKLETGALPDPTLISSARQAAQQPWVAVHMGAAFAMFMFSITGAHLKQVMKAWLSCWLDLIS